MSSMVSKWPVLVPLPITAADVDDAGALTVEAAERLFARARDLYLAGCRTLEDREVEVLEVVVLPGDTLAAPGEVTVSVSVVEVFPDRFTMHVRIRPVGGDGVAAEGGCSILAGGGTTDEIRDELIARAHAAEHYH